MIHFPRLAQTVLFLSLAGGMWFAHGTEIVQGQAASPDAPEALEEADAEETDANEAESAPASPGAAPDAAVVSDEVIEQLAQSLLQIQPLLEQASAELLQAADEDARRQIEQRFETQATRIVEAQGLTVQRYRQLVTRANSDREFGRRVGLVLAEQEEAAAAESESEETTD